MAEEKTVADAGSFEEHKKLRAAQKESPAAAESKPEAKVEEPKSNKEKDLEVKADEKPAKEEKAETKVEPAKAADGQPLKKSDKSDEKLEKSVPPVGGESAGESDTPEVNAQGSEPGRKPRRSATERAKELLAEGRVDEALEVLHGSASKRVEARLERLEEELRTSRTRKPPEPETSLPAKESASAPTADAADLKPDKTKYNDYEDYLVALSAWGYRQEEAKSKAQKQQTEQDAQRSDAKKRADKNIYDARQKYPDFEDIVIGHKEIPGSEINLNQGVLEHLMLTDGGMDMLYDAARNYPAEIRKLQDLPPAAQLIQLGRMAHLKPAPVEVKLNGHANGSAAISSGPIAVAPPAPEPPKPVVTRVPRPPTPIGGTEPPSLKPLSEAKDMDEYKRIRRQQLAQH